MLKMLFVCEVYLLSKCSFEMGIIYILAIELSFVFLTQKELEHKRFHSFANFVNFLFKTNCLKKFCIAVENNNNLAPIFDIVLEFFVLNQSGKNPGYILYPVKAL